MRNARASLPGGRFAVIGSLTSDDIEFYGHSIVAGYGAVPGFASVAADLLGVEPKNFASSGSQLTTDNVGQSGGWANIMQNHVPGRRSVLMTGINDYTFGGDAVIGGPFFQTLYSVLSRLVATQVYESSHASVTYPAGTWASLAGTETYSSGSTLQYTTTNNAQLSIAVPSNFPGGVIALQFPHQSNNGALYSVAVDGVSVGALDARTASIKKSGEVLPYVFRTASLAPGAHTIGVHVGNITGAAYFDCWQVEHGSPTVLLCLMPKLPAYTAFVGYPFMSSDATIDNTLNAYLRFLASFFPTVKLVNFEPVLRKRPELFFDTLHPNSEGARRMGELVASMF